MDDFIDGKLDKYNKQLNGGNGDNILLDFGKNLSNSIFNHTSLFALLSYSLGDNVKVSGAKIIDNNSINVTIEYNDNKINSAVTPSVTVVAYKLDIDMMDIFTYLISSGFSEKV